MTTILHPRRPLRLSGALDAIARRASALLARWRLAQARRRAARQFAQLDSRTLQDIGASRGEFDSFWAEAHHQAPLTRRRVLRVPVEAQEAS